MSAASYYCLLDTAVKLIFRGPEYLGVFIISHHYARRRFEKNEILQHEVSKAGKEKAGFISHTC